MDCYGRIVAYFERERWQRDSVRSMLIKKTSLCLAIQTKRIDHDHISCMGYVLNFLKLSRERRPLDSTTPVRPSDW